MNELNITLFISALAEMLSQNLSETELALAAAAFTQLGDTISTILAARACSDSDSNIII